MNKRKFPTKAAMREAKIISSHRIASLTPDKVYIAFLPATNGRGGHAAKYQVIHIGYETDPKGPWYDYGQKTFNIWAGREKEQALKEALSWVEEKFGHKNMVRDPYGSYQVASAIYRCWEVIENAKKESKA